MVVVVALVGTGGCDGGVVVAVSRAGGGEGVCVLMTGGMVAGGSLNLMEMDKWTSEKKGRTEQIQWEDKIRIKQKNIQQNQRKQTKKSKCKVKYDYAKTKLAV